MASLSDITTSLQAFWSTNAPLGVPTLFPGSLIDTSQVDDWIELWLQLAEEQVRRTASPLQIDLSITIHCLSRSRRETVRSQTLADQACTILARRSIAVVSSADPSTTIGYVRSGEPSMRNLTRVHAAVERITLQHFVVSLPARFTAKGG